MRTHKSSEGDARRFAGAPSLVADVGRRGDRYFFLTRPFDKAASSKGVRFAAVEPFVMVQFATLTPVAPLCRGVF
jgi:hypothetical protein